MELKLNSAYTVECGIIIPRSRLKGVKAERYAVFDVLTMSTNKSYAKKTRTFSTKELRKMLKLGAKEKIEIC